MAPSWKLPEEASNQVTRSAPRPLNHSDEYNYRNGLANTRVDRLGNCASFF